jgi:hypothetical protein
MTRRMDWRRARLHGRPSLSVSQEHEWRGQDRASRWLKAVARNQAQRERRSYATSHSTARITQSSSWATVSSSSAVPW